MMDSLFDRRCRLTFLTPTTTKNDFKTTVSDVLEIDGGVTDDRAASGMRLTFEIKKTDKKEPNCSRVVVTNLNESTRSSLQKKGVRAILEAGYRGAVFRIFSGDVRTADHVRDGGDWNSTLQLGDGERSWRSSVVNESFSPGTSKADVMKIIARRLGIDVGNVDEQAAKLGGSYDQGYAAAGSASKEFDRLMRSLRLRWSVQDGSVLVLAPGESSAPTVPLLTPDSGLIGSPEMGSPPKKGKAAHLNFKALLFQTRPGSRVKIKCERYDGEITVSSCTMTGDTHGGDWYTEVEGVISK